MKKQKFLIPHDVILRKWLPVAILIFSLAASVFAAVLLCRNYTNENLGEIRRNLTDVISMVHLKFERMNNILTSFDALYASSKDVESSEFQSFYEEIINDDDSSNNMSVFHIRNVGILNNVVSNEKLEIQDVYTASVENIKFDSLMAAIDSDEFSYFLKLSSNSQTALLTKPFSYGQSMGMLLIKPVSVKVKNSDDASIRDFLVAWIPVKMITDIPKAEYFSDIKIEISDYLKGEESRSFYRNFDPESFKGAGRESLQRHLFFLNRVWTFKIYGRSYGPIELLIKSHALVYLAAALFLNLLIYTVLRLLYKRHDTASTIAREMTDKVDMRESEIQAINNASPLGVFVMDLRGTPRHIYPLCQKLTGLSEDELMTGGWYKNVVISDRERVMSEWLYAVKNCTRFESSHQLINGNWISVKIAPFFLGDTIRGFTGTVENINKHKRYEELLLEVNKGLCHLGTDYSKNIEQILKLMCLVAKADTSVYLSTENKLYFSDVLLEDKGRQEIKQAVFTYQTLMGASSCGQVSQPIYFSNKKETSELLSNVSFKFYRECIMYHLDKESFGNGQIFLFFINAPALDTAQEKLMDLLVASVGAEEEKFSVAKQLKRERDRCAQIVDIAPALVVRMSPNGNVISINESGENITGYKKDELLGKSIWQVLFPDELSIGVRSIMENVRQRNLRDIEVQMVSKDGRIKTLNANIAYRKNPEGFVEDILFFASDMTERRNLEEHLRQSQKMQAVGRLAGGVAHEINNPLTVVLGFSQSLLRKMKPEDPFQIPMQAIEREARRCSKLVSDLLTFSRQSKDEKREVDLNAVVDGALTLVKATSAVSRVVVEKRLELSGLIMNANPTQIQQVIINLANNAIDAMPGGGEIKILTEKITDGPVRFAHMQISDTGVGMPEEVKERIFEPFFTTKDVGKGTGLGLALVYEIVKKHEGIISVTSELGKGTTFDINLPLAG